MNEQEKLVELSDALTRISNAVPDRLDYHMDMALLERIINLAKTTLKRVSIVKE